MKIYALVLLGLLAINISTAQIINIPDPNLKAVLTGQSCADLTDNGIYTFSFDADTNNDGEIDMQEAEAVYGLFMSNDGISSLEGLQYFTNLKYLGCTNNQISSLAVVENHPLEYLFCAENSLTQLDVSNYTNLITLHCDQNMISTLDVSQNPNLVSLECYENQISSLDVSQNPSLEWLNANTNLLTDIDVSQNPLLVSLNVCVNGISSIDVTSHPNLEVLWVWGNNLTELDLSQNPLLERLGCWDNNIEILDVTNNSNITKLYCRNNDMKALLIKNGSTTNDITFGENPNLEYVCIDPSDENIINTRLSQYGYNLTFVNSYCSYTPGGDYYSLNGENRLDSDLNGCDLSDIPFINFDFLVEDDESSYNLSLGSVGTYSVPFIAGTSTVTPNLENPEYYSVVPQSITVNFPTDPNPTIQDFCFTPLGDFNDLEVVIVPLDLAIPGFTTTYQVIIKNKGTTSLNGSFELDFEGDVMDFVAATVSIDEITANSFTWNFGNIQPNERLLMRFDMEMNTPMEIPPLNANDIIRFTGTVFPVNDDQTPEDNVFELTQLVVGSQDPNDKTCLQGPEILVEQVGDYLHYLIRFENIGTANARFVVIKDVIEGHLDISSLVVLDASHDYALRVIEGNTLEFYFDDIDLPFDDDNNDGYVVFKIRTQNSLQEGDVIRNQAEIFFDYNFPILTNESETTVVSTLSIPDLSSDVLKYYPNPAQNVFTLESSKTFKRIEVLDISGKLLDAINYRQPVLSSNVDISQLSAGMYFVKVSSDTATETIKILKE